MPYPDDMSSFFTHIVIIESFYRVKYERRNEKIKELLKQEEKIQEGKKYIKIYKTRRKWAKKLKK